jgi:hypothetical protein
VRADCRARAGALPPAAAPAGAHSNAARWHSARARALTAAVAAGVYDHRQRPPQPRHHVLALHQQHDALGGGQRGTQAGQLRLLRLRADALQGRQAGG